MNDAAAEDKFLICHCVGVRLGEIRQAIRDGARSVEDLQRITGACTGCQSCFGDCREIIAETVKNEGLKEKAWSCLTLGVVTCLASGHFVACRLCRRMYVKPKSFVIYQKSLHTISAAKPPTG